MQPKVHINEVLKTLELPLDSLKLMEAKSAEEAEHILNEFKLLVKKQHRILVKKYHPDLPANKSIGENKIKKINAMVDIIKQLKITKLQQRPRPITVRFYSTNNFYNNSSTTSSTPNYFSF